MAEQSPDRGIWGRTRPGVALARRILRPSPSHAEKDHVETRTPAVAHAGDQAGLDRIPVIEARETSGITSKLVLAYAEREGGRAAVEEILRRCDLQERESEMRDEDHWFPFATKIALFEAAAAVLDDPHVMRRVGETALDLGVADGLKVALRALGSPGLLYKNVIRANAKFNAVQGMQLLELSPTRARIRFVDLAGVGFHTLDCDYNVGLLSCAPKIFGQPPARI